MKKPEKKKILAYTPNDPDRVYNKACNDFDMYFLYLLSKIPSDKEIDESPHPNYAKAYYQGQFDILMDLKRK